MRHLASWCSATTPPSSRRALPRYLPVDVDRRLTEALTTRPENTLAAAALRLQRACGLRIGELLDLELDCVHDLPEHGSWLKVPLGKLDTERMIPIDTEIVDLIDQIIELRSPGRADAAPPLPPTRAVLVHPPRPTTRRNKPSAQSSTEPPSSPAWTTSPPTSSATPTPPPWSTPASPCKR